MVLVWKVLDFNGSVQFFMLKIRFEQNRRMEVLVRLGLKRNRAHVPSAADVLNSVSASRGFLRVCSAVKTITDMISTGK